jgi:DNA mismatch repair protein MutL
MTIRRLDPTLIDRIAAGEVVERPASALKELVENAIDAGASRIDIVLENGGRKLIRITDNGSGMSGQDLELCIERHATSKLPTSDLTHILTLGFRGEALPSIASVARLSISTRTQNEQNGWQENGWQENGWQVAVDAGQKSAIKPKSAPFGTCIEVRDLFYATPARLKFLKSDRSEAQASVHIIKRLAIAHPDIHFTMEGDGFTALNYTITTDKPRSSRLAQILGREFRDNSVEIDAHREGLNLTGFVSLPTFHRATASEQYFFVNGRPVRDKVLLGALRAAYMDVMRSDRHSIVALFMDCDPRFVDVNVHPAKTEVRFQDAGMVRGLMIGAIREALSGAGHRASTLGGSTTLSAFKSAEFTPRYSSGFSEAVQAHFTPFSEPTARVAQVEPINETAYHPLGAALAQVHENYILAQTNDGFVLVDQHAAHERLVYERLKQQRMNEGVARQILLIPEIIDLDENSVVKLQEFAPELMQLGLVLEPFGAGAIAVQEVPSSIAHGNITKIVRALAETIDEWGGAIALEARVDLVLKTIACHYSVRSGRRMRVEEMNALLRDMEETPSSGQCNHGRPTYVELKLSDIERLFGRT